ncbi:MAG: Lacal_2735 family protein [Saprospiraceae bacterium]|nr:Lacal_2735 family protein [Saprospiraceae bacterium]
MFNFFKKDPLKKLQKQYLQTLEAARDLQRRGDIKGFSQKSAEAEEIALQIEQIKQKSG